MKAKGKRIAIGTGAVAVVVLAVAAWVGWPWILFLWRFESLGPNAQGFPEYRHRQTGIVMVKVPGGKFWMGAQKTDPNGRNYDPQAENDEGPVHELILGSFLIGKYEVTQEQWLEIMGNNPSSNRGDINLPVDSVSWRVVQEFLTKTGLLLPTEAEWEYACRSGNSMPFAGNLDNMGWYVGNCGNEIKAHPVQLKAPNAFGVHDMHGNMREWCEDDYVDSYAGIVGITTDPVVRDDGVYKVLRGGCYYDKSDLCRSTSRMLEPSYIKNKDVGVRVAWRMR